MSTRLGILVVAMAASVTGLLAQSSTNNPSKVVIIGCLQGGAQNAFTLKDDRSGRSYRIDADAESIGWHVGHELEVHGTLEVRPEGPRVKADQVIFVATKCSPPGPAKP